MGLYTKVSGAWQEITPAAVGTAQWAKVTGGTVTEVTNGDGSVDEIHRFTASGTLTVLQSGYARVLIVGGGMAGNGISGQAAGSGGGARDSIAFLAAGSTAVVVGAGSAWNANASESSLGALSIGGAITNSPGVPKRGGGGLAITAGGYAGGGAIGDGTATTGGAGLSSDITGSTVEYGKGGNKTGTTAGAANTGCGNDGGAGGTGPSGVVIVRVQKSPATTSGVAATGGTETTFVGDGVNGVNGQSYKVHTFTAGGTLTVTQAGEAEILICAGGAGGTSGWGGRGGGGAGVTAATLPLPVGAHTVVVGAGGSSGGAGVSNAGRASRLGSLISAGGGLNCGSAAGGEAGRSGNNHAGTNADGGGGGGANGPSSGATPGSGVTSYISGSSAEYGKGGLSSGSAGTLYGQGGNGANAGRAGVVIVRYKVAT